jgi:hypothetical protein
MKKLLMLSFWGVILLLSVAPLAAQNSVDVLNGPQPVNSGGCTVNPQCIPASGPRPPTRAPTLAPR